MKTRPNIYINISNTLSKFIRTLRLSFAQNLRTIWTLKLLKIVLMFLLFIWMLKLYDICSKARFKVKVRVLVVKRTYFFNFLYQLDIQIVIGYGILCALWFSPCLKIIYEHKGLKCSFKNLHKNIQSQFQNICKNFFEA